MHSYTRGILILDLMKPSYAILYNQQHCIRIVDFNAVSI